MAFSHLLLPAYFFRKNLGEENPGQTCFVKLLWSVLVQRIAEKINLNQVTDMSVIETSP
jgi:hypothetical protein